jgi:hypothetical protein
MRDAGGPGTSPARQPLGKEEAAITTFKAKNSRATAVTKIIAGLAKHFPNAGATLTFGNATRDVAAVKQALQSFVDLRNAASAAQAAAKEKIAAERAQAPALLVVIDEFVSFVRATFGNSPEALADFGLVPRKGKAPRTAEQVAAAVAKRKATREKRHTMGKVQKKAVKAAVRVTVEATPMTEVPTAAATPAGGGSGASNTASSASSTGVTPSTPHA